MSEIETKYQIGVEDLKLIGLAFMLYIVKKH